MPLAGHLRTVVPRLLDSLSPVAEPPSRPWSLEVEDPRIGPVRLSGLWSAPRGGGRGAVLVVHGLGGCAESPYARRAAAAALDAGLGCLRLNLRGADRRGEDYYHAGLDSDLAAALASPELAAHERLWALGFSLGGHLVLRLASGPPVPRLAAVAAISAPLDLSLGADAIDRPGVGLYRGYLLASLKRIYAAVAARRPVPLPLALARRIRRLREWDERVVAPRHGFLGAEDYYRRASVAPRLGELTVPALLVAAEDDPMVPAAALRPALAAAPARLNVRWLAAGGHLGMAAADLGAGHRPLAAAVLAWLESAG